MKDIVFGCLLLFACSSCVQFWLWFIDLDKSKQIKLKDYIFKENKQSDKQ